MHMNHVLVLTWKASHFVAREVANSPSWRQLHGKLLHLHGKHGREVHNVLLEHHLEVRGGAIEHLVLPEHTVPGEKVVVMVGVVVLVVVVLVVIVASPLESGQESRLHM